MVREDMDVGLVSLDQLTFLPAAPKKSFRSLSLKTTDLGSTVETMVGEDMDLGLENS